VHHGMTVVPIVICCINAVMNVLNGALIQQTSLKSDEIPDILLKFPEDHIIQDNQRNTDNKNKQEIGE